MSNNKRLRFSETGEKAMFASIALSLLCVILSGGMYFFLLDQSYLFETCVWCLSIVCLLMFPIFCFYHSAVESISRKEEITMRDIIIAHILFSPVIFSFPIAFCTRFGYSVFLFTVIYILILLTTGKALNACCYEKEDEKNETE